MKPGLPSAAVARLFVGGKSAPGTRGVGGYRRLRCRDGPLIAGRPQFDRTGTRAIFAPMSLRAIEALARPAMVTNENFFSHVHPVCKAGVPICQALFSRIARPLPAKKFKTAWPTGQKKHFFRRKKLANHVPVSTMRTNSDSISLFIMNLMIAVKRGVCVLLMLVGLALCAIGAANTEQPPCDLPAETSSQNSNDPDQSPEHPQCLERVNHNGMILCLPCPAAAAHVRHGDVDIGPCSKPGNETPPGQN